MNYIKRDLDDLSITKRAVVMRLVSFYQSVCAMFSVRSSVFICCYYHTFAAETQDCVDGIYSVCYNEDKQSSALFLG